ncbi:protein PLANT CADMIUM RESISTANCE 10 isoform X2 [Trifolium pratense]|uniref:Uncharacterized protein n=1 Tax=Trifolium pratense TaxID=57577 RepID=A0ACB0K2Q5_TRIPR|nr:protein PLANT CADMIUM RESISTANCE 10 isoform X2 [Trifolium pratense]XP_045811761.1 protein PLANT CADMIUM RESISTANCE 10 isoform X2 [Trifolium pratense]CAJ2650811.1 unnamed protein product [Trifolium pratense]
MVVGAAAAAAMNPTKCSSSSSRLNGLLESVLVAMICQAVCYFLLSCLSHSFNTKGCIGCLCPCYVFGKNAEFLGSGTFMGSCVTHFILWSLFNTACCLLTDGLFWGLPGCLVSCYACGYRGILRSKYNLPEAPCGDFVTHCCCHLCAICQEYREIRERAGDSEATDMKLAVVTAPPVQTMKSDSGL